MSRIILTGDRPTGRLHVGHYVGSLSERVKLQNSGNYDEIYIMIADAQALTDNAEHPEKVRQNIIQVALDYLACGIDPEKAAIYVQSDVKEVLELYLYLNMNAYLGELQRVTSFKEKARKQPENVNAGLLTYPTLMAADILIHRADKVPVGKDQEQNMEMARKFARRFNTIYGVEFFPEPQSYSFGGDAIKVPGLDGSGKMGKSEGNAIYLIDDAATIRKKVMKAVTDSGPTQPNSEKPEAIANLFTMLKIVSSADTYDYFNEKYNACEIRYGDLKKQLAEDIVNFTSPIRERILAYAADTEYMDKVAREGAEKARASADKTIREVRKIIGFN